MGLYAVFSLYYPDGVDGSDIHAMPPQSFQQAKIQAGQLFYEHRYTLYCHCAYDKNHEIDLASCQMQSAQAHKRAKWVEYEHMMPAEQFGRHRVCWRESLCQNR